MREAPAHFTRHGKHYIITSGTTGYLPNPSEVAMGDSWHGQFHFLGNPHLEDKTNTSFHSQVSSIFKVEGKKDLYIACADRWLPTEMHREYETYSRSYEMNYNPWYGATKEEAKKHMKENAVDNVAANTSIADYVWLPLWFQKPSEEYPNGMVFIDWYDEWKIEDYE